MELAASASAPGLDDVYTRTLRGQAEAIKKFDALDEYVRHAAAVAPLKKRRPSLGHASTRRLRATTLLTTGPSSREPPSARGPRRGGTEQRVAREQG